jgi:hypothetical protein
MIGIILYIIVWIFIIWGIFWLSTKVPEEFKQIYMVFAWFLIGIFFFIPIIVMVLMGFVALLNSLIWWF